MATRINPNPTTPAANHGMPTQPELAKIYGDMAFKAVKDGTATKLSKPPANADKYPSINVTPKGLMGVGSSVSVIKGELYLRQQVVAPGAKPTWFKIGPEPMFAAKPNPATKPSPAAPNPLNQGNSFDTKLTPGLRAAAEMALRSVNSGSAKALTRAPAGAEKAQSFEVTPKGLMGVGSAMVIVGGEVYLRQTVVAPGAKAHWFKCGPLPMM